MSEPNTADWVKAQGLPGLFDVHTHFMHPRVMAKVQDYFDQAGPKLGRAWPIRYRGDASANVATLRALGVRRFSALFYAHKPEMAEFLNEWGADFAAQVPEVLHCATFFPEPGVTDYVRQRLESGVQLWKVHVQVGDFEVTDPLLDEAWGLIAAAQTPVVVHAGSGPVPGKHTGPGPMERLLQRHPDLPLIMAHMGGPEYHEFVSMAERYDNVRLDTTMVFTDFMNDMGGAVPDDVQRRVRDLSHKVLLGTDFPNIPYAYQHQLDALESRGFGSEWLRAVCWNNAVALFGDPNP